MGRSCAARLIGPVASRPCLWSVPGDTIALSRGVLWSIFAPSLILSTRSRDYGKPANYANKSIRKRRKVARNGVCLGSLFCRLRGCFRVWVEFYENPTPHARSDDVFQDRFKQRGIDDGGVCLRHVDPGSAVRRLRSKIWD